MNKLHNITGTNRLFTYKVSYDGGSAPNPFHGLCTLAICKPKIRSVAKKGDVVVGLGCGSDEPRIIYCMVVDESVTWEDYIEGCKTGFLANNQYALNGKIPKDGKDPGDCIWKNTKVYSEPLESWSGHGGEGDFERDILHGKNVIFGKKYWYFGKGNLYKIHLPDSLYNIIIHRQGHRSNSNNPFRDEFVKFFNTSLVENRIEDFGVLGDPALEPETADPKTCSRCRAKERDFDTYGEEIV